MADRKVFYSSVVTLPNEGVAPQGLTVQAVMPEDNDEVLSLNFALETADTDAQLEAKLAKGEVVPAAELSNYGSKAADVDKLVTWLKAEGFDNVQPSFDGTSVYAKGKASQISKSLLVDMRRVTKEGSTFVAAQNAPSLPMDVGAPVHDIIGLQPFRHANKHAVMQRPKNSAGAPAAGTAAAVAAPAATVGPPFFVSEINKAYGADGLTVTGKGQTIAILIDTAPLDTDLTTFWQRNGLPVTTAQVTTVNVNGGTLPPREGEETLDVEWTSGIATGAQIRVYASGSLSFVDLDKALDAILADLPSQPGMRQLSISLGLGETFLHGPQGEVATQHKKYLRLAAAGVNVFVSTGDAGSNPDSSGHSSNGPLQAEYSSTDPFVVAVGGTSLFVAPNGSVASEIAWSSGGGGKSLYFKRPVWQNGAGVPGGSQRVVPDVSLAADPNQGAFVIFNGNDVQIGGTSWSAPVWAGFCALINEARISAGKPALTFLNPLLYPLIGTSCFRDITKGTIGAYDAGPGYDMATGLGVPNVAELIKQLP